jgi:hypothetical protein
MQSVRCLLSAHGDVRERIIKLTQALFHPVVYLFILAILAYGLLLPTLGLYGDDWEFLYGYYRYGHSGFEDVVGWMRPYSVLAYRVLASIFGLNILAYHIYVLIARWFTAVLVWKILCLLFPEHQRPVLWTASLFLIYPAFYQQTLPLSFSLHFTAQVCFLLSILLMLLATKAKTGAKILLNVFGTFLALSIFLIEYFAGLEFLRPVLLYLKLKRDGYTGWKQSWRVLFNWMPYLLIQIGYYVWRIFFFESGYQDPILVDLYKNDPSGALQSLISLAGNYLVKITFTAWGSVLHLTGGLSGVIHILLILIAGGGIYAYFQFMSQKQTASGPSTGIIFLGLGIFAMLISGIPVWSTLLPYNIAFPLDRLSLPFLLGSSLFWVGLVLILMRDRNHLVIFTLMISLSIGAHFLNANSFRRKANEVNYYFWQLTWRMPALKPGTYLLSQKIPLGYYSDNNLTPLVLWTYAPDDRTRNDPYRFYDLEIREGNVIPTLQADAEVIHPPFESTVGSAVVIFSTPTSCVRVLTKNDPMVDVPTQLIRAAGLTNLSQIITQPAQPAKPPDLLGPEPAHDWCYYFSKADLARQEHNWHKVATLGDEAFGKGFEPITPIEYFPFIEGYAYSHQLDRALQISEQVSEFSWIVSALCRTWAEIELGVEDLSEKQRAVEYTARLNCTEILANPNNYP